MAAAEKPIAARLRERCVIYTTVCTLPIGEVREAADTISALQAALKDLTDQISATGPRELGHDLRMNDAYLKAVELLTRLEALTTSSPSTATTR